MSTVFRFLQCVVSNLMTRFVTVGIAKAVNSSSFWKYLRHCKDSSEILSQVFNVKNRKLGWGYSLLLIVTEPSRKRIVRFSKCGALSTMKSMRDTLQSENEGHFFRNSGNRTCVFQS